MNHRLWILPIVQLLAIPATAEDTFLWETPEGWFGEKIQLPPGFAPAMSWKGFEEIRFAPGMFKASEPDFFSYALLFSLEPDSDISKAALEKQVLLYYQGLSSAVSRGKGRQVDIAKFKITIEEAKAPAEEAPAQAKDANAYTAQLDWIEPFATGKPQALHIDIHAWKDESRKRTFLFFCATPSEQGSEIRKALTNIRKDSRLKE